MFGPIEPSADARQAAYQMRQMYLALINEGFPDDQALALVAQMILAAGMNGGHQ